MEQKRSTAETEALWKERIARLEASGLTHKDRCAQNHIATTTMRYWRRRLKEGKTADANPPGFLRAVPVPEAGPRPEYQVPDARPAVRSITIRTAVIEFPENRGAEAVREMLRVLQSL
jgi:transposase-like protein